MVANATVVRRRMKTKSKPREPGRDKKQREIVRLTNRIKRVRTNERVLVSMSERLASKQKQREK